MTANAPTPESRILEGASGTPVKLSDGNVWLLADGGLLNVLDGLRDKIDDDARLTGEVNMIDVAEMAAHLVVANYELDDDEARRLVIGSVDQELADAVTEALFGQNGPRRTYTSWAASALLANGIDPASVPSRLMPHVLHQLEGTKRCMPRGEYIESAEAARRIAGIRARATRPSQTTPGPTPDPNPAS